MNEECVNEVSRYANDLDRFMGVSIKFYDGICCQ